MMTRNEAIEILNRLNLDGEFLDGATDVLIALTAAGAFSDGRNTYDRFPSHPWREETADVGAAWARDRVSLTQKQAIAILDKWTASREGRRYMIKHYSGRGWVVELGDPRDTFGVRAWSSEGSPAEARLAAARYVLET